METAAPSDRRPPLPDEPLETLRGAAGPSDEGSKKRDGSEKKSVCRMPDGASSAMEHHHLRRLLLLLALVASQLLSALGFVLRWLGHALEELAGVCLCVCA
mgnify:CR=1 FL=1|jgi:hypothetical protein